MKRRVGVALCAAVVLGMLAGCAKNERRQAGGELVGRWRVDVDLSQAANALSAAGGMSEFAAIDDFKVGAVLDLKDDGSYFLAPDEAELTQAVKSAKELLKEAARGHLDGMIQDRGLSVTVEGALSSVGLSLDKLLDEVFNDQAVESLVKDLRAAGQYRVEEGRLYLSDGTDRTPGEGYVDFVSNGDILHLSGGQGSLLDTLVPVALQRVDQG